MNQNERINFSETDCHQLIDIVSGFRHIVECRKFDGYTWREKKEAWETIAVVYNCKTTEPRTWEQLRCKYDDLKKYVREYLAQINHSRNCFGEPVKKIKSSMQLMFDKIHYLISYPSLEFSASTFEEDTDNIDINQEKLVEASTKIDKPESSEYGETMDLLSSEEKNDTLGISSSTPQETKDEIVMEVQKDSLNDNSKMNNSEEDNRLRQFDKNCSEVQETRSIGNELQELKKRLLLREAEREEEYHKMRMDKKEKVYNEKIHALQVQTRTQMLQQEKLQLEIALLKKKL